MHGYDDTTYGDAFADVYDEWYGNITDVVATVDALAGIAMQSTVDGAALDVVELGVGTGRIAIPLAARLQPATVWGIDSSRRMLDRLDANGAAHRVRTVLGDMVDALPPGPLGLVFVAFNTFFALGSASAQQRCFDSVASRLASGGSFVIEAFVPDDSTPSGDIVEVRSMRADEVVLSISRYGADQTAEGHLVQFSEAGGVRLRPWSIRYASVAELDAMATHAGFGLAQRWESFAGDVFTDDSQRHVSVYSRTGL